MVGSNFRQFRVRYLNADHLDTGVNKDMIDAAGAYPANVQFLHRYNVQAIL